MRIHKNVFELIGNTPLVELTNYENNQGRVLRAGRLD